MSLTEQFGSDDWRVGLLRSTRGHALSSLDRHAEAVPALEAAYQCLSAARGTDDELTLKTLRRLVIACEGAGQSDKADTYRALLPKQESTPREPDDN